MTTSNLRAKIQAAKNVAFCPGGFVEATLTEYGVERVVVRTGALNVALKLAIENGSRVHPMYTFGEVDSYRMFTGFVRMRMWLALKNAPAALGIGHRWAPWMPRLDSDVLTYVGKPLQFSPPKSVGKATKEEVAAAAAIYEEALVALFDEFKADAGRPTASLQIVAPDAVMSGKSPL